mmetsp:Transcript_23651/g.79450  ORF Transcript_23651/g.79450 Transcript_23651/m.79450 type:complete len:258 (+) Transcript_23651:1016-1789(+)
MAANTWRMRLLKVSMEAYAASTQRRSQALSSSYRHSASRASKAASASADTPGRRLTSGARRPMCMWTKSSTTQKRRLGKVGPRSTTSCCHPAMYTGRSGTSWLGSPWSMHTRSMNMVGSRPCSRTNRACQRQRASQRSAGGSCPEWEMKASTEPRSACAAKPRRGLGAAVAGNWSNTHGPMSARCTARNRRWATATAMSTGMWPMSCDTPAAVDTAPPRRVSRAIIQRRARGQRLSTLTTPKMAAETMSRIPWGSDG